jgi:aerobic carbon-monoxide dehydrogenase medium subunit
MRAFQYYRAESVAAAVAALQADEEAKLIAGGQTLLPSLKLRLASPSTLIDLGDISELSGIQETDDGIEVRSMTKHAQVAVHGAVLRRIPSLGLTASRIGDRMVRNMGTIGGSVANNDPAADYPAALLALDATVVTTQRSVRADAFFVGMFETVLERAEIITAVKFKAPLAGAYVKFRQPASRFAIVGVFVARYEASVRVAVTGAGPLAFRLPEFEMALGEDYSPRSLAGAKLDEAMLNSDLHASASYRASIIPVIAARAVAASLTKLPGAS